MECSTSTTTRARTLSVRFEDTCVLIPPPCRIPPMSVLVRPRLITKSYSLPLWKTSPSKKTSLLLQKPIPASDRDLACVEAEKDRSEKKPFSLTVSVPSLTTKSRSRRSSLPLPSPCLARRNSAQSSPSTPSASPTSPVPTPSLRRTPSVPKIQSANLKQAETIPLRPCCEACHSCVDAALAEGERWSEKWSSGAVRRYSEGEHVHLHAPHPAVFGVTRVWAPHSADTDPEVSLAEALKIDEVDAKRRSGDFGPAMLNNRPVPPSANQDVLADSEDDESCLEPVPSLISSSRCHAPVVQEEDEDLLFPLPSPRRSPNHTPSPTPSGSQVSLAVPPSGSQTNLSIPPPDNQPNLTMQSTISPPTRTGNVDNTLPVAHPSPPPPVSISISIPPTQPTLTPTSDRESSPTHKRQASPAVTRSHRAHRPSFSSASGSFIKGSASVLKGVAAGMTGGGAGVGVVR